VNNVVRTPDTIALLNPQRAWSSQDLVETLPTPDMSRFELLRTQSAEMAERHDLPDFFGPIATGERRRAN